ncbi:hypothetical protein ACTJKO_07725 [Curtobacterium sp. 22159]
MNDTQRCGATARVHGEAVRCDLLKGHDGQHRDYIEDARWGA